MCPGLQQRPERLWMKKRCNHLLSSVHHLEDRSGLILCVSSLERKIIRLKAASYLFSLAAYSKETTIGWSCYVLQICEQEGHLDHQTPFVTVSPSSIVIPDFHCSDVHKPSLNCGPKFTHGQWMGTCFSANCIHELEWFSKSTCQRHSRFLHQLV